MMNFNILARPKAGVRWFKLRDADLSFIKLAGYAGYALIVIGKAVDMVVESRLRQIWRKARGKIL